MSKLWFPLEISQHVPAQWLLSVAVSGAVFNYWLQKAFAHLSKWVHSCLRDTFAAVCQVICARGPLAKWAVLCWSRAGGTVKLLAGGFSDLMLSTGL